MLNPAAADQLAQAGQVTLDGEAAVLQTFGSVIDKFETEFNMVTP